MAYFKKSFNKTDRPDFRTEVTDMIISALENGVETWRKPWVQLSEAPYNPVSKSGRYQGGNRVNLTFLSLKKGYLDPRWVTYKQATDNGWQVRKGEKSSHVEYWQPITQDKAGKPLPQTEKRFIHRVYSVFNASQVDGMPALDSVKTFAIEPIEAAEAILRNSGANITYGGSRAFYRPSTDSIQLPVREHFTSTVAFYATALHELAHWTGHATRLNRLTKDVFGTPEYAKEELRAELASLMLQAEIGITYDGEQQAAYIGSWIEALKKDKNEIFRAAKDAEKIVSMLLGRSEDKEETGETEVSPMAVAA